jgi:uncharacterized membrane protein YdjX (TVP38/TMEM64 family)
VAAHADVRRLRRRALLRVGAAIAVLLAVFVVARAAGFDPSARRIERWADGLGLFGPVLFVAAGVALNCLFVPLPVIAGAAGLVFGTAEGTAVGVLVVGLSAAVHLEIGRRLAGERAELLLGRRGAAVADFLSRRGFLAVLYVRLIPGLPFNSLNYAAGLSRLRARDMFAGTALGFAPRTFAYAALGGSLGNLHSTEARVAIVVGIAMAVAGAALARHQIRAERRERAGWPPA